MSVNLLHGDSKDLIQDIASHSIDLILTDPPYNVAERSGGTIKMRGRKDMNTLVDEALWDKEKFVPQDWVTEFQRILKPTGNIFAFTSYALFGKWHQAFDTAFTKFQFMVWHKTNPAPKVRKYSFLSACELIVCMWNDGHTWNFGKQSEMHNFFEAPICMGKERLDHPTQKPLSILKHIINIASNEGDTVFDPFMGVGSVGDACIRLNRKYIGIDSDKNYFNQAGKRLILPLEQNRT